MKSAIQWFEELKVPFDGDITIRDIILIQEDAFNEGVTKSAEMCGGDSHIEQGVFSLLKKPLAKSQQSE